jgi:serine/threonine-protein kinase
MAPEQVLGKRVDRRTDVFAMGVVLWESLTGTRLWANIPEPAILGRLASGLIPSVRSVSPDVPEELDAICARAMQVDPDHRFSSALEFQQALDAFVARMTVTPTRRDLAQLMNSMFAQQRQRLRAVIDATLSGAAAPAAELLPMLAPFQPPPNHSGLTLPPTAVTSTHARGGQPSTTPSHRGTTAGVVIGLAVAAALVFGVAIGATARRPTSKSAATVPSGAPNVPVAAAPLPASAAPTDAPPPLAAEGETVATPPLAPTTSGANVGTKSSGARATRAVPAAAAGGGSASPDRRAPVTRPRPGDVDLGY